MDNILSLEYKPDPILWSEKLYSRTHDYFDNLNNSEKNTPISRFNYFISNHLSDLCGDKQTTYSYAVNGKFNPENAMYELLVENSTEATRILGEKFDLTTVNVFALSKHVDRVVLCLVAKENSV